METVTGLSGKPVDVVVDPAERQARGLPEKIDSSEYHFGTRPRTSARLRAGYTT